MLSESIISAVPLCQRSIQSLRSTSRLSTRLFSGGKIRDGLGIAKGYANNSNKYVLERHTLSGLPTAISKSDSFIVLGIESSCHDTGVAIVRSDGTILSNTVLSQVLSHYHNYYLLLLLY